MRQSAKPRQARFTAWITAAALALLRWPAPGRAWGPVGHDAIAEIAEARLSPRARQAIQDILGADARGREVTLQRIANCADAFSQDNKRLCADDFLIRGSRKRSKSWHFIDLRVSLEKISAGALGRRCRRGNCVLAQIRKDIRALKNPRSSAAAKQKALMFLVHFVGDAHQPLHCADDHDQGGNGKAVNVLYEGQPLNLHTVWDDAIEDHAKVDYRLPGKDLSREAGRLAARLEKDIADRNSRDPAEIASWTQGDDLPGRIVGESWAIARNIIYPEYAQDHGHISSPARDQIGRQYKDKMQPIAYQRIEMAGVRLAFLLNQIF